MYIIFCLFTHNLVVKRLWSAKKTRENLMPPFKGVVLWGKECALKEIMSPDLISTSWFNVGKRRLQPSKSPSGTIVHSVFLQSPVNDEF